MRSKWSKAFVIAVCVCSWGPPQSGMAQSPSETAAIQAFKTDLMKGAVLSKSDTLLTSDSILTRTRGQEFRTITSRSRKGGREHFECYFNDTEILESELYLGSSRLISGIFNQYDKDGSMIYSADFDKGIWTVYKEREYPFLGMVNALKSKADSLLTKIYGKPFLARNAIWSIQSSYVRSKHGSGYWADMGKFKPTSFLFRYDVRLDSDHIYNDAIEFELNSTGEFIPDKYEETYGFEKLPGSQKNGMTLTYEKAIRLAKREGLSESDSVKAEGYLQWVCSKSSELFNGHFEFYVLFKTSTRTKEGPKGQSNTVTKYDVYSFNPWTSAFNGKKKMKTINFRESIGGVDSGLLPDQ
jgi:hypothetical protein